MTQKADEAKIREMVENWAKAVRAKEMESVLAHHAPDILMFDVPMPFGRPSVESGEVPRISAALSGTEHCRCRARPDAQYETSQAAAL
jgi:hypothetical protein